VGHLADLLVWVQGGDFESTYLLGEPVHESPNLVEVPVYEVPYLGVVEETTHQEKFMDPDLGEDFKKLDLGRFAKIGNQGAMMVLVSDKKLDLGVVDKIIDQGARMLDTKNKEHEFRDAGGGGTVGEEIINKGHPGEEGHAYLLDGDDDEIHRGGASGHEFRDAGGGGTIVVGETTDNGHPGEERHDDHQGEVRVITDLGGDDAGDGGTVVEETIDKGHPGDENLNSNFAGDGGNAVGGQLDDGHPGEEVHQDLLFGDG
jgi:hypothetical protein